MSAPVGMGVPAGVPGPEADSGVAKPDDMADNVQGQGGPMVDVLMASKGWVRPDDLVDPL